jgi:hypothetical protein
MTESHYFLPREDKMYVTLRYRITLTCCIPSSVTVLIIQRGPIHAIHARTLASWLTLDDGPDHPD